MNSKAVVVVLAPGDGFRHHAGRFPFGPMPSGSTGVLKSRTCAQAEAARTAPFLAADGAPVGGGAR